MRDAFEVIRQFIDCEITSGELFELLIADRVTKANVDAVFELLNPELRRGLGVLAGFAKRGGSAIATGVGWIRYNPDSEAVNAVAEWCERHGIPIDAKAHEDWWAERHALPSPQDDGFDDDDF